jgi:hypothetical protein
MESSGGRRSGLLTAGGILSIIGGAFEVIGGGAMVALALSPPVRHALLGVPYLSVLPSLVDPIVRGLIIVGVPLLVLGAIAIIGGVSAARRKSFGLSLAGAICALPSVIFGLSLAPGFPTFRGLDLVTNGLLRSPGRIFCSLPSVVLGILAVIFIALGKREFRVKGCGVSRRGLLTAGGILSIVAGTFEVIGGGAMVALAVSPAVEYAPFCPMYSWVDVWADMVGRLIAVGVPLLVLGAIAIVGGVSAARRKSFGLSLAGAICALPSVIFGLSLLMVITGHNLRVLFQGLPYLISCALGLPSLIFCTLPSVILGILAVVFVALGKREFGAEA